MSGLVIEIAKYKSSPHFKKLNRADAVGGESPNAFNGKIDTDAEKKEAAKLICGGSAAEDVKKAEACLVKALGIKVEAEAGEDVKGAQIKSARPSWGKSGLKAAVSGGKLTIKGTLEDSEQYSVSLASELKIKKGQSLLVDVKVKGSFTWGGKNLVLIGLPKPQVSGGRIEVTDGPWVVIESPGKGTVKVVFSDNEEIGSLTVKTGGMSGASIEISNIRVK